MAYDQTIRVPEVIPELQHAHGTAVGSEQP